MTKMHFLTVLSDLKKSYKVENAGTWRRNNRSLPPQRMSKGSIQFFGAFAAVSVTFRFLFGTLCPTVPAYSESVCGQNMWSTIYLVEIANYTDIPW